MKSLLTQKQKNTKESFSQTTVVALLAQKDSVERGLLKSIWSIPYPVPTSDWKPSTRRGGFCLWHHTQTMRRCFSGPRFWICAGELFCTTHSVWFFVCCRLLDCIIDLLKFNYFLIELFFLSVMSGIRIIFISISWYQQMSGLIVLIVLLIVPRGT